MDVTILSFWAALVLLIGALEYAMPQLTRRDIFFSVTVAPEFRESTQAQQILAGYRRGIVVVTSITLVLILLSGSELVGIAALMLEPLAVLGLFLRAHRQTIAHKRAASTAREASLEPQPRLPGLQLLLAGPYLMLACAAVLLRDRWSEIADPMPVHWDLSGNPNGWLPKSSLVFWELIGSDFALCLTFTFTIVAMVYFSRQISATGAQAREERRFRWIGIALLLAADYLSASLAFLPLNPHATLAFGGVAFFLAIIIVGSLELVRRGQGGVRLAPASGEQVVSDRTPDQCWKWGIFYYNPEDPALMVEKRFGIGWTLNFAHRGALIFLGLTLVMLVFSLAIPLIARHR
jgi:uncharacterized membrane protein